MEEVWKDIKFYEGLYQVSNFGRIKALAKIACNAMAEVYYPERLLCVHVDARGHVRCILSKNGSKKNYMVHKLVADAFLSQPEADNVIIHIDGNKANNHVDNLQWSTRSKIALAYAEQVHGENHPLYGRTGKLNPTSKTIHQLDKNTGEIINTFDSLSSASKITKINAPHISLVCNGKRSTAGGYKWAYK